ncbi:hypothetical protein AVEN_243620-1 [Araneus ventricosus]|uniref:Uncharacterized protein n=1 Tax=Araneus ventricosus TaxID=182803 RepID=A0A4Y2A4L8_ARAVE|nr:hypothetical protein AVEN_243620-1 [Araneus ventricosus]
MKTFCSSGKTVSPNTQLNHGWYKNHMDFMYYAEDGTTYLFTRDYYYENDVSAGCTLKLRVTAKFGINEYCEMLLIYGECVRKAKSALLNREYSTTF